MTKLKDLYFQKIRHTLKTDLKKSNIMAVPKLLKIIVNCGLGEALKDKKVIESMSSQLAVITGQKPQVTKARLSISTFKLREGDEIGLKVTLRGNRMYDFFMKLVNIALPRVRDFRGLSASSFDGHGNYTLGISEQIIFPELEYKMIDKTRGFEITIITSASDNNEAKLLLKLMGMPFEKEDR